MLTDKQIEDFKRDGVICLRGVLDENWLTRLDSAIEKEVAKPKNDTYDYPEGFVGSGSLWRLHRECDNYCRLSVLPELAAGLLGSSSVRLYIDQLFVKEPGSTAPTPWHNDQPYFAVSGWQVMSFWMSLDSVTKESGAVEYVCGSHRWDRWFQPVGFSDEKKGVNSYEINSDYEPMPDIDAQRDELNIISFDVEPGDVIAFHALTVHGAGGNFTSDRRRRGYTVRYIGDDVRYDPRAGTNKKMHFPELVPGEVLNHPSHPIVWPASN